MLCVYNHFEFFQYFFFKNRITYSPEMSKFDGNNEKKKRISKRVLQENKAL